MRKILLNNFRTHKLCLIFVSAIFVVVDVVVVVCIIYYYDSGITTNKQCTGIIIVIVDCICIKYIFFFQKKMCNTFVTFCQVRNAVHTRQGASLLVCLLVEYIMMWFFCGWLQFLIIASVSKYSFFLNHFILQIL